MTRHRRVVPIFVITCCAVTGANASGDPESAPPEAQAEATDAPAEAAAEPMDEAPQPPTIEEHIRVRTNEVRREKELTELTHNPALQAAAQALADHMAKTGVFSHSADGRTPAERVEAQSYHWRYVAENIAFRSDPGATVEKTGELLLEQWLNSPGHRANILSPAPIDVGIATAVSATGEIYAVQVFAAPLPAAAP